MNTAHPSGGGWGSGDPSSKEFGCRSHDTAKSEPYSARRNPLARGAAPVAGKGFTAASRALPAFLFRDTPTLSLELPC
ncbi:hypothetical protein SAMN06297387_115126 [Streptomyces zhaozhouensis]|uniref:Uncharacterized protein n=1 Tax=Streptomyces zhaozhouensis TaxID=1300267 RepID=A0A286E028_9ACTN|nr:hypothetical protein SAMN06297387_115126 [Streptomyces zhaozhouensis]